MVKDYTRVITHQNYRNAAKLKKYYHRVAKKIYIKPSLFGKNYTGSKRTDYIFFNDEFLVTKIAKYVIPIMGGIVALGFLLIFIFPLDEPRDMADWVGLGISAFTTVLFTVYGFTMPKKEGILNRRDGLITFTGFMWEPDITMEFKKVEFAYSTGGENMIGAFQLQIIRPNKWFQTFEVAGYIGKDCYANMSFITWYMDKNRPLPPGASFDAYREQDYQRRKAAGFPRPLYPSVIETPEATKEQQAERKRIGGW
ncbi:hypothetical protein ACE1MK_04815 [Tenacibaculum maritimum]|uniref:hypothetical protein n=1 Tax=Tenacibaculum maritimum TaxID=107401 RepID=UPI0012E68D74|nr:hypothetical protein [Tenacibaculum maritimum]CAA0248695.1 Probable transmembrane hypothetical protein [Tenacibaculum maritimum]